MDREERALKRQRVDAANDHLAEIQNLRQRLEVATKENEAQRGIISRLEMVAPKLVAHAELDASARLAAGETIVVVAARINPTMDGEGYTEATEGSYFSEAKNAECVAAADDKDIDVGLCDVMLQIGAIIAMFVLPPYAALLNLAQSKGEKLKTPTYSDVIDFGTRGIKRHQVDSLLCCWDPPAGRRRGHSKTLGATGGSERRCAPQALLRSVNSNTAIMGDDDDVSVGLSYSLVADAERVWLRSRPLHFSKAPLQAREARWV